MDEESCCLEESEGRSWEVEVRIMNCIKMYVVSWTILDGMVVRDQTSKGVPAMFWKHDLRKKDEEVEWKVAQGCNENEFVRGLKSQLL
jgi:hypothetical protein